MKVIQVLASMPALVLCVVSVLVRDRNKIFRISPLLILIINILYIQVKLKNMQLLLFQIQCTQLYKMVVFLQPVKKFGRFLTSPDKYSESVLLILPLKNNNHLLFALAGIPLPSLLCSLVISESKPVLKVPIRPVSIWYWHMDTWLVI